MRWKIGTVATEATEDSMRNPNGPSIEMLPRKPTGSGPIVEHEYDVTVRRGGFASYDITAHSENAKKLLGVGTFTYEQSEWNKLNKDLKHYGYSIEVR